MANLQETSTWEAGIYQLETSDPVMGGENGIDNRAPRQLANRTLWLKNELARQIGVVNTGKLGKTENAVSASKLATARNIAMTGDGSWNVNFDGSQNATGALTLANSGVTAGSYNSVTVDAKGRVTAGLTQTHGLVTATTAQGTSNVATGNGNTFLNIVASGVGQTASVGSSTQITGTNGITVSSDTAGKLIVGQVLANSLTDTSTAKALTALQGKVLDEKIVALGNEKAQLQNNKLDKTGGTVTGEIISTSANAYRLKSTTANRSVILRSDGSHFYLLKTADGDPDGNWDSARPFVWDLRSNTVTLNGNSATATKLATARTLAITGDGTGQANFDGSANANIALTLANSGVTAGSYNSVTVDAKGRVTAGLTQTHGLVTATTATGTANVATGNGNTFLNIVASGVGQTASVGSSTQITGTNGITVSSDTAGKLIVGQTLANSLTDASTAKALTANMGKALKDELDTTVKLTGDQTITGRKTFGEITVSPASIDNSLIMGVGSGDIYIKNTVANKYLQFKNDGTLAISNDKVWLYSDRSDAVNLDRTDKVATAKAVKSLNDTKLGKTENAVSATKLQTARNIALTGAVTGNVNFDGSGNVSIGTALNLAEFTNLKAENGYQRLPNGLILQWGKLSSDRYLGESAQSITFPIAFPTTCLNVQASMYMVRHSALGDGGVFVVDFDRSTANFSLQNIGTNSVGDLRGFYWFAIGY